MLNGGIWGFNRWRDGRDSVALKEGCESTAVYFDGDAIKKRII